MPECLTPAGCPIRSEAPDRALNARVNAFCEVEMLELAGGHYAGAAERLIRESGLGEESVATVLEAKSIVSEYRASKQHEAERRAKARRGGGMR